MVQMTNEYFSGMKITTIIYDIFFRQLRVVNGFPHQGARPTCDCISGPRLIPAVSWGHPAYIMRALPHVGLSISGRCATTPPWILGLRATQHRTLFGLNFNRGEVSSPTHPDYPSFLNWPETSAVQVHYSRSTVMHWLHKCSAQYSALMLKPGEHGARAENYTIYSIMILRQFCLV